MTDFRIRVIIDPGPAQAGARQVEGQLKRTQGAADSLQSSLFKTFAAVGITAGIAGSIRLLADYSQAMSTVRAVTGATAEEFEALDQRAQDLGRNTRFTATEAAGGMELLARAGFTAKESLEAVEGTLKLAQAGGLGIAEAADIASNSLRGFRLEVSETGRVVDVLATAANASNTSVEQLGDGMKFVAPIAAGLGVDIETTTAALGKLSDSGLQASLAGTGLRRVLAELESPSTKSAQILKDIGLATEDVIPSQVGLVEALTKLRDAGLTTGQALELFGDRGGPAFEVLASNIPAVVALEQKLRQAGGTADRVAAVMDDNLNGALLRVKSAFEGLLLSAADNEGGFTAMEAAANGLATGINFLSDNINAFTSSLVVLGGALLVAKLSTIELLAAEGAAAAVTVGNVSVTELYTVAQLKLAAANLTVAGSLKAIAFAPIPPFLLIAAAATAAFFAIKELNQGLKEYDEALKIADAGELSGLTEFAKFGAQIQNAQKQIQGYKKRLDEGKLSQEQYDTVVGNLNGKIERLRVLQDKAAKATDSAKKAAQEAKVAQDELNLSFERTKRALEEETRVLGFYGQEQEAQARLSKEIANIQKEGGPELTSKQQEELLALIKKNQVLQEQADAYDSVRGPQEDFVNRITALKALLEADKINLEEFNKAISDLAENSDGIDLEGIKLPEGSNVDLTGAIEQIKAAIEAERERVELEQKREQVLRDLADPLAELEQRQAIVNQLNAEGAINERVLADETARINEEIKKLNPEYALQAEILKEIKGPQEELALRVNALNVLFAQGKITLAEYEDALEKARAKVAETGDGFGDGITRGMQRIEQQVGTTADQVESVMVSAFNGAADALTEFVTTGELDYKKFAQSIIKEITKIIIQELILQAIRGASGFFGGGAAPGVTGSASGGPFGAGDRMIVGEKGPELVSFNQPGVVTPANQTEQIMANASQQGGGTTVVATPPPQVNLSVVNVDDPQAARDAMSGEEGAEVFINQVRKNRTALKRELQ